MNVSSSYARPRPTSGAELYSWLFMRISGLVLLFLALGHLVIMHLINNVDRIDYQFVAARWAGWFWRGYDLVLLTLALIHGLNGLRVILDDYVPPAWRRVSVRTLYLVGAVMLALGVFAAVSFHPVGS